MTTALTDRKAKWRKAHPDRNRKRRKLDDENQRIKRKKNKEEGKPSETPLVCSKKGCNAPGQVHHAGGKREIICRQHHQKKHNLRGDGPGSNGPGRNNEHDHAGGLVHHGSHNIIKESIVVGIRHSTEPPVPLEPTKRGNYAVKGSLLANLTKSE